MSEHSEPTYEQLADELRGMRAEAYLHKRLAEQLQAKLVEKQCLSPTPVAIEADTADVKALLRLAYDAGWAASSEGHNAELVYQGEEGAVWCLKRDAELREILRDANPVPKPQASDIDRLITQLSEGFKQSVRENIFDDNQEYLLDYVNRLAAATRKEFLTPLQLSEDEILRELAVRLGKPLPVIYGATLPLAEKAMRALSVLESRDGLRKEVSALNDYLDALLKRSTATVPSAVEKRQVHVKQMSSEAFIALLASFAHQAALSMDKGMGFRAGLYTRYIQEACTLYNAPVHELDDVDLAYGVVYYHVPGADLSLD